MEVEYGASDQRQPTTRER